jgi:hypothetical protein
MSANRSAEHTRRVEDATAATVESRYSINWALPFRQVNHKAVCPAAERFQAVVASKPRKRVLFLVQDGRVTRFVALPLG